jgi:hypothetical protein
MGARAPVQEGPGWISAELKYDQLVKILQL